MQAQFLEALNNALVEKDYENCSLGEFSLRHVVLLDALDLE
jgi:hypothetical protein